MLLGVTLSWRRAGLDSTLARASPGSHELETTAELGSSRPGRAGTVHVLLSLDTLLVGLVLLEAGVGEVDVYVME